MSSIATATHLLQLQDSACESGGESAANTLEWCEARRIGSEPAVCLQTWPSLEWERDDDDVFTVTDADVWGVYPEDEAVGELSLHVQLSSACASI